MKYENESKQQVMNKLKYFFFIFLMGYTKKFIK